MMSNTAPLMWRPTSVDWVHSWTTEHKGLVADLEMTDEGRFWWAIKDQGIVRHLGVANNWNRATEMAETAIRNRAKERS